VKQSEIQKGVFKNALQKPRPEKQAKNPDTNRQLSPKRKINETDY